MNNQSSPFRESAICRAFRSAHQIIKSRTLTECPFEIGQKVICIHDDDYHYKSKGQVYTVKALFVGTDLRTWFMRAEESGVSSDCDNFAAVGLNET